MFIFNPCAKNKNTILTNNLEGFNYQIQLTRFFYRWCNRLYERHVIVPQSRSGGKLMPFQHSLYALAKTNSSSECIRSYSSWVNGLKLKKQKSILLFSITYLLFSFVKLVDILYWCLVKKTISLPGIWKQFIHDFRGVCTLYITYWNWLFP